MSEQNLTILERYKALGEGKTIIDALIAAGSLTIIIESIILPVCSRSTPSPSKSTTGLGHCRKCRNRRKICSGTQNFLKIWVIFI